MHRKTLLIISLSAALLCSCVRPGNGGMQQPADTVYTWQAALSVYAYQPERALEILDSAVIVGNLSEWKADMSRARVYSSTMMKNQADSLLGGERDVRLDTARAICERLLTHDSVKVDPKRQQDVLEILTYAVRMQNDTVAWLMRLQQLADVCREVGSLAVYDGLRTEAEIGAALCAMGQMEQGLAKMDSVILVLNDQCSFAALDAQIIASKRQIVILASHDRYAGTLPLSRRIIQRLDDYEANPERYHDGSHREPKTDDKRAGYIRFYRSQAQNYITAAYSALEKQGDMLAAFRHIEQSVNEAAIREYMARYNALQQQMEAEHLKAQAERTRIIAIAAAIIALLAIGFAVYVVIKNRIISRKNAVLVQQIADTLNYKELYQKQVSMHEPASAQKDINALSDEQLFRYIDAVIVREKLFADQKFERQTIMERFSLSKERVGAIFSKGSGYSKISNYIQTLRLEYAARLLVEQPEKDIVQIAAECGFSSHKYFSDRFRQHFSMTPTEYRKAGKS